MHELGIVFHIIRSVEEVGRQNGVRHVSAVTLELGEVSGVLEDYLQDCWNWAVSKSEMMRGARLQVVVIPAKTLCEACGTVYPTVAHGRICPECGSEHTHLVRGNETMIRDIAVPEEEGAEAETPPASGAR